MKFLYLALLGLYLLSFWRSFRPVEFIALCLLPVVHQLYGLERDRGLYIVTFALAYAVFLWGFKRAGEYEETLRRLTGWVLSTGFVAAVTWSGMSVGDKRLMLFYMVLGPLYAAFRGQPSENPLRREEP